MEANVTGRMGEIATHFGTLCPVIHPPDRPFGNYPSQWALNATAIGEKAAVYQDAVGFSPAKALVAEGSDHSSTLSRCGSPSAYSCSHPYYENLSPETEHTVELFPQDVRGTPQHFALARDITTTNDTDGSLVLCSLLVKEKAWVPNLVHTQFSTLESMKINLEGDACCNDFKAEDTRTQEHGCDTDSGRSCIVKSCFHCGTTKTPLWRSGPQGPKSLCNACGIRFKKSRKHTGGFESSDMQVSSNSNGVSSKRKQGAIRVHSHSFRHQEDKSATAVKRQAALFQRRTGRWPGLSLKRFEKHGLETAGSIEGSCMTWNLSPPSASSVAKEGFMKSKKGEKSRSPSSGGGVEKHGAGITRVFGNDEEEAAALLMALSCGLVHA